MKMVRLHRPWLVLWLRKRRSLVRKQSRLRLQFLLLHLLLLLPHILRRIVPSRLLRVTSISRNSNEVVQVLAFSSSNQSL